MTGRGSFVDDVDRPGQLFMRVVRSTCAHGLLRVVDATEARSAPGVAAVVTGGEIELPPIPVRISPAEVDLRPYLQPVLARDRVRYVGEPIAAVVAHDPYAAEDAAELVLVEYDELPVVLDAESASTAGACSLFVDSSNEVTQLVSSFGDPETAFAQAQHVVSFEAEVGRQTAVPLETRGLVAEWGPEDSLEIWGSTKVPHFNRRDSGYGASSTPRTSSFRFWRDSWSARSSGSKIVQSTWCRRTTHGLSATRSSGRSTARDICSRCGTRSGTTTAPTSGPMASPCRS